MARKVIFGTDPLAMEREGLSKDVQPWEDGIREDTSKGRFEWWYYDAHFGDGTTAVVVFMTKPILERAGPLKPGISITITPPDGEKLIQFPIFSPEDFAASREFCEVRIGDNWTKFIKAGEKGWQYQIFAESDGLSVELQFEGVVPPWRPGAGKSYFDDYDHYFAWLPAIPYGTVKGILTYRGEKHEVTGTGYHDHNWGNVGLDKVLDHWYWARAHIGEYTLIFVEQVTQKRYGSVRIPVFMLMKGGELLTGDGSRLVMNADEFVQHPDGHSYPKKIDFYWNEDNNKVHIALRNPKVIEAVTLLGSIPIWKQKLIRLFANPYYFRFNAEMRLTVDFNGTHDVLKGNVLYELMLLR